MKKWQVNKFYDSKLEVSNDIEYKVKTIQNSIVYINKAKRDQLLRLVILFEFLERPPKIKKHLKTRLSSILSPEFDKHFL